MDKESELISEYNRGFKAGKLFTQQQHDNQFWLRTYAGQAMQGMLANGDHIKIKHKAIYSAQFRGGRRAANIKTTRV